MFYTVAKISEKPYEGVASTPPHLPPVRPRVKMFQESLDHN